MSVGSFFLNIGHIQPLAKLVRSSMPYFWMSLTRMVRALTMLNPGLFFRRAVSYLRSNCFQSSFGQPSSPAAVPSLESLRACWMCISETAQFRGERSGSGMCWEAGIVPRTSPIRVPHSRLGIECESSVCRFSWYFLAKSTMRFVQRSYCVGLDWGIFNHRIRSLGFLPLLIADHLPPSLSSRFARSACSLLLWFFALTLSRCSSSFARNAVFVHADSLTSKSGDACSVLRSLSMPFIHEFSLL